MKTSSCFLAVAAVLVLVPSCASAPALEDEPVGETSEAIYSCDPKCGANGKNTRLFWLPETQQFYRDLATNPITQLPASIDNLPADGREEILRNAVECALTQKQAVVDGNNTYTGWWGIAPGWAWRPLSADERRWVTGCMVQRLNALGQTVNIVPEANTPALYKDAYWEAMLPFDESMVWGDVFSGTSRVVHACWGTDIQAKCGEPARYLNTRICDQAKENCHLDVVGPCSDFCQQDLNGYWICKDRDSVIDDHPVHVQVDARKYCGYVN